ncbi:hypothetical protein Rsub_10630 [Raphidocelis subcapitata]|uniref:UspA domain-containing protein n=1 Tax=Raphidocelis subcapitata TaxID=307507 RepID=A0A2V0PKV6_9CHLO|nr:hypothetical protein Rsub_10630 [Raphidocelis subcapitata]|eukprot:GBF97957.1 hypothetical protein Rsub_10630 [Raphidocelis subcapitata]
MQLASERLRLSRHPCSLAPARPVQPRPDRSRPSAAAAAMRLLIALDGSAASEHLVESVAAAVRLSPDDEVHLASVLPPPVVAVPPSPVATAAAVTAVLAAQEQQARVDEARARDVLQSAAKAAMDAGVPRARVHAHLLPAAGGASGVGESVVEFVRARSVDVAALGSRGLGSFQRSVMSLVGLGSVSDYATHHMPVPVLVVRPRAHAKGAPPPPLPSPDKHRVVVLAVDDSVHSSHALDWAAAHVTDPRDELHVVCVALPAPYPVSPILDETSATVAAVEASEWRDSAARSLSYARELAERAAARAAEAGRSARGRVVARALAPEGGAGDVGAALVGYAGSVQADLVVVGSRGMGSVKRSVMGFGGLGSVSDYLVHHLSTPVLVVKGEAGALPREAAHAAGAAEAARAADASG